MIDHIHVDTHQNHNKNKPTKEILNKNNIKEALEKALAKQFAKKEIEFKSMSYIFYIVIFY